VQALTTALDSNKRSPLIVAHEESVGDFGRRGGRFWLGASRKFFGQDNAPEAYDSRGIVGNHSRFINTLSEGLDGDVGFLFAAREQHFTYRSSTPPVVASAP
jgi:hypothetical protein